MIENSGLYGFAKEHAPQAFRNQMRSTVRSLVDVYAGVRGLSPRCMLPDFLIVGAQKAGTTSLFNWLVESGSVQSPIVKEVGFFDARWHWPINYRGSFKSRKPGCLIGEATPRYLPFPEVPQRVSAALGPECKIIVVLRDPIDRTVSHYFHERRLGFEKRSMHEAMTEEDALIEEAFDGRTSASRRRYILTHCSYVYRSRYSERLAPWFEHFDRSDMLFLRSEDMFGNPRATLDAVSDFLGVELGESVSLRARNRNAYVFEDERVAAYLKDRLGAESRNYADWVY